MKVTSTIPSPYFFYPGTSSRPRSARWQTATHPGRPTPAPETGDDIAHKQEVVCGVILALSSAATVVLCLWQLAIA